MPIGSEIVPDDATSVSTSAGSAAGDELHSWVLHRFPPHDIEVAWRGFLSRVACPGAFETPEFFLDPHDRGKNPFAVCAFRQAEMIGVLTGFHPGKRVISGLATRPQVSVARNEEESASEALLEGLLLEAGSAKVIDVFSWNSAPLRTFEREGFRKKGLLGDVVLDLRSGPKALFQKFHENRKRNIRTAVRHGIEVAEVTSDQDLEDFWLVHCGWRESERKKIRAHSSMVKAGRIHALRSNHRRFIARYQGKPIAATHVRFCPGGLIEYAGNCSVDEFIGLRPNDLLIWKTIEWACEQGFTRYSLGAAHPFLRKAGGVVEPIDRYRLDRTFLHRAQWKEDLERMSRKLLRVAPDRLQRLFGTILSSR